MEKARKSADKVARLYELYEQEMFRVCLAVLGDESSAEDALSESFLKLIRARDRIREPESSISRHFAVKTAKNTAIDLYRRRSRDRLRLESLSGITIAEPDSTDAIELEDVEMVEAYLGCLSDGHRRVLECIVLEGLTIHETASLLRVSEVCVRKRLERAKKALREKLTDKRAGQPT